VPQELVRVELDDALSVRELGGMFAAERVVQPQQRRHHR
jgi:hypothetical protein